MLPTYGMGTVMIERYHAALQFLKLGHRYGCLFLAQAIPKVADKRQSLWYRHTRNVIVGHHDHGPIKKGGKA